VDAGAAVARNTNRGPSLRSGTQIQAEYGLFDAAVGDFLGQSYARRLG